MLRHRAIRFIMEGSRSGPDLRFCGVLLALIYMIILTRRFVIPSATCGLSKSGSEDSLSSDRAPSAPHSASPAPVTSKNGDTREEVHTNGHADSAGGASTSENGPRPKRAGRTSSSSTFPRIVHQSYKTDQWAKLRPDHRAAALSWRRLHKAELFTGASDEHRNGGAEAVGPPEPNSAAYFEKLDAFLLAAASSSQEPDPKGKAAARRQERRWLQHLWSDAANDWLIKTHYPDFYKQAYSEMESTEKIYKIDSVRFAYMHRYGGIYADLDFFALRNWDDLLPHWEDKFGVLVPSFFSERRLQERAKQEACYDEHFAHLSERLHPKRLAAAKVPKKVAEWRAQYLDSADITSGAEFYSPTETSTGSCVLPKTQTNLPAFPPTQNEIWQWGNRTCAKTNSDVETREKARREARALFSGEDPAWSQGVIPNALMISKPGEDFWLYCLNLTAQVWRIETRSPLELGSLWQGVAVPEMVAGPGMVHRCVTSYRGPSRVELLPRLVAYPAIWLTEPICGLGYDEDVSDEVGLERALQIARNGILGEALPPEGAKEKASGSEGGSRPAHAQRDGEISVADGDLHKEEGGWSAEKHKALLGKLDGGPLQGTYAATWWSHIWPDPNRSNPQNFGVVGKYLFG